MYDVHINYYLNIFIAKLYIYIFYFVCILLYNGSSCTFRINNNMISLYTFNELQYQFNNKTRIKIL